MLLVWVTRHDIPLSLARLLQHNNIKSTILGWLVICMQLFGGIDILFVGIFNFQFWFCAYVSWDKYAIFLTLYNNIFTMRFSFLKGIVQPEMKIYLSSGHRRCRLLCFFIGTDWEKFSIISLAHQWILCGEWVPSKYHFITHNNASSSEEEYPLLSSHIKIHRCACLDLFSLVNGSWDEMTFSLEKILWIEHFYRGAMVWS